MATDNSNRQTALWPLPKFNFQVKIRNGEASFAEISGLDTEQDVVEYRAGNSTELSKIKMPDLKKYATITMKRGIFTKDNRFWEWINSTQTNTLKRESVVITLLDESGNPAMVWTLINAWPTKITGTDLRSAGNEVAVEAIELTHEGFTLTNS